MKRTTTKQPKQLLLTIRVSPDEKAAIVSAARKSRVTISSWLREVAVYAAKRGYSVKTNRLVVHA